MEARDLIPLKKIITDKFPLLAGITALGYLVIYFHQVGFSIYYGYPEDFIFFDLSTLLKSAAILYAFAILVIFPISMLGILKHKKTAYSLIILITSLIYFSVFETRNPLTFFTSNTSITLLNISLLFILPFSYMHSIRQAFKKDALLIQKLLLIVITGLNLVIVPSLIAKISSFKKPDYYQLKDNESFVLLSSSGGKMIFGSCNNGNKTFLLTDTSPTLTLVEISSKIEKDKIRDCYFNSRR